MTTEMQKFSPEAIAIAKKHFTLPHGLLESIAETIKSENPEGSALYEKAYRLDELVELTRDNFPNERQSLEMATLGEELLWQVEEFNSTSSRGPAWPWPSHELNDYRTAGLS